MTAWKRQLGFLTALFGMTLQGGCTDKRTPPAPAPQGLRQVSGTGSISSSLISAATVKFQNTNTETLAMVQKTGSLYLTGRPFGFSRWDISADAEKPTLTFAAVDQIDTFAPVGKWVVDWYASGALGLLGTYAFLSGTAGMSVIDISSTNSPREALRKPPANPNEAQVPRDEAFVYRAIVANPSLPVLYGFREQDYVYTMQVTGDDVQLASRDAYGSPGVNVCCVHSATIFSGMLFVAFGSKLVWFTLRQDGRLGQGGQFDLLQATNVASTDRFLYVQHSPTYGQQQGINNPRGFYVFDENGENVDYIASNSSPKQFTVHPGDSHLYMNNDDTSIQIYRILHPR